ncbi:MAG: hypothetical protein GXP49_00170 [Deltaproteobacteria bacterium]|nr:hypothetical protein [Deltaproteobacteria bacterium]
MENRQDKRIRLCIGSDDGVNMPKFHMGDTTFISFSIFSKNPNLNSSTNVKTR